MKILTVFLVAVFFGQMASSQTCFVGGSIQALIDDPNCDDIVLGNSVNYYENLVIDGANPAHQFITIRTIAPGPRATLHATGGKLIDIKNAQVTLSNFNIVGQGSGGENPQSCITHKEGGHLVIASLDIGDCHSPSRGGAVYASYNGQQGPKYVSINGTNFFNNSAGLFGGALYTDEVSLSVTDSHLENNQAPQAGALSADGATLGQTVISGSTFRNNHATSGHGGAIAISSHLFLSVSDSIFRENTSQDKGGAIFLHTVPGDFVDVDLIANSAANLGGGLFATSANITFRGQRDISKNFEEFVYRHTSLVEYNTALNGGGIYIHDIHNSGIHLFEQVGFRENTATHYGGALHFVNDIGTPANYAVDQSDFYLNNSNAGGAVYLIPGSFNPSISSFPLTESTFVSNSSTSQGGGLYLRDANALIERTNIYGNSSGSDGGGLYVTGGAVHFSNSSLAHNFAQSDGGGIYLSTGANAVNEFYYSTLIENISSGNGTAIYAGNSTVTDFQNSIVFKPTGGSPYTVCNQLMASAAANIQSDTSCGFNITSVNPVTFPVFELHAGTAVYYPISGGPAHNGGLGFTLGIDQLGNNRTVDDIGAIEL